MSHFTENRYHLHLIVGFLSAIAAAAVLSIFAELKNTEIVFQLFAPTFFVFFASGVWEWYFELKGGKFDWMDIFWSAIGGLIGSLIFLCF